MRSARAAHLRPPRQHRHTVLDRPQDRRLLHHLHQRRAGPRPLAVGRPLQCRRICIHLARINVAKKSTKKPAPKKSKVPKKPAAKKAKLKEPSLGRPLVTNEE